MYTSDVARPLSYNTKTTFYKDHQIINPRPQKNVPLQKKIRPVMPVLPSHAGIMPVTEKPAF